MTVRCASCTRITENVKTVKGKAPCCGTWNSLFRVEKKYLAISKKKKVSRATV